VVSDLLHPFQFLSTRRPKRSSNGSISVVSYVIKRIQHSGLFHTEIIKLAIYIEIKIGKASFYIDLYDSFNDFSEI
jgi:hypothetical protein